MRIIETCPKCGHDLTDLVLTTYPPIPQKKCFSCGWEWTGKAEEVVRVPFGENTYADTTTISLNDQIYATKTEATLNRRVDSYITELYVRLPVEESPLTTQDICQDSPYAAY